MLFSQLFIPSVQIFSFSDIIPFHVQLSGPLSSLRQFFPQVPSSPSSQQQSTVTVTILRQIAVDVRGTRSWKNTTIGEGKIRPVPPASYSQSGSSLDWEGEVQCLRASMSGGSLPRVPLLRWVIDSCFSSVDGISDIFLGLHCRDNDTADGLGLFFLQSTPFLYAW